MDIKSVYESSKLYKQNNLTKPVKTYDKLAVGTEGYSSDATDTVTISPEASFKQTLDVKVKEFAKASSMQNTLSSERLEQLKQDYQGDNCPVSSSDVAGAMLSSVCGHNISTYKL